MPDEGTPVMRRRDFLGRAGALGALATFPGLLGACGDDGGSGSGSGSTGGGNSPLKLGMLIPLSGNLAAIGPELQSGLQIYLDEHDGALGGRPVELIVEDSEGIPEAALRKAQKLIRQDQVDIVTGIISSAVALGVRDLFHESRIPLVISTAAANTLTRDALSPYIFRSAFSNYQPSVAMGTWLGENGSDTRVYLAAADYEAGLEMLEGFRIGFEESGGTIVGEVLPPLMTTDYQPFLATIADSDATAVFAFFPGGDAVTFVKQYSEFGLKEDRPLFGTIGLTDPEGILAAQGPAALGVRVATTYSSELDNELNAAFVEAFTATSDGALPSPFAALSHNAAQLIDVALTDLDGDTSDVDAVVEALENVGSFDTPAGSFEMDPETHNPIRPFYLVEAVQSGDRSVHEVVEDLGLVTDPG